MGSKCCGHKEKSQSLPQSLPPSPARNASKDRLGKGNANNSPPSQKPLFKAETEDIETTDQKKVIEDERLEKELKHTFRGGDSAYGKVKAVRKEAKKKALSASNYNVNTGLVDKRSQEFKIVQEFMASKGYQLIDSIGTGNYAEVYKAFMVDRSRYVAVKVIDLTKANENYRVSFLPREISILRQLKHPGVIKTYEVSQTVNRIFMIMEFCSNGTVTDWLRDKGAFGELTAWEMDKRILDGLNYMHHNKIAHRDLKLENILITDKLYPKLSDFSYAVIVDQNETQSTTFCGSLPYFAPEILQRKPHNPLVSDVWALGVCFFIMVSDGLPFKIDDERQMLNKQLEKDWEFKKKVQNKLSNDFKQMIRKMIEPDVNKRVTTSQLMAEPWIKNQPKTIET